MQSDEQPTPVAPQDPLESSMASLPPENSTTRAPLSGPDAHPRLDSTRPRGRRSEIFDLSGHALLVPNEQQARWPLPTPQVSDQMSDDSRTASATAAAETEDEDMRFGMEVMQDGLVPIPNSDDDGITPDRHDSLDDECGTRDEVSSYATPLSPITDPLKEEDSPHGHVAKAEDSPRGFAATGPNLLPSVMSPPVAAATGTDHAFQLLMTKMVQSQQSMVQSQQSMMGTMMAQFVQFQSQN